MRGLTLTGLYNRLERRREALGGGAPFAEGEEADHLRANVPALASLHDDLDRAALGAWGWDDLAPALVGRPGATLPSDLRSAEQEVAEDELLARLVALNAERRAEEARGQVRWLRASYQLSRLGRRVPGGEEQGRLDVGLPCSGPEPRPWLEEPRAQFGAIRELLDAADAPLSPEEVARAFKGRLTPTRRRRVGEVLAILADLGFARRDPGANLFAARR